MSVLSQPVRQWGVSRLSALRSAVSRALSALPAADSLRSVPTPRAAFRCESALLTVVGVLHVLAPLFVLRASFAGSGSGREKEVAAGCADERSEELVGALLVALIQAAGGLYLLTASLLCTAAEVATRDMLLSLSAGHLLNAVLYLCIALNFPLPAGSLALTLASLALHAKLSAALCFIAHKQPQPAPPAEPASIAKRGAGVRPATGRSAASGGAQAERALLQELDVEEEEEEEQGGSDEAKRRGALADRAFAATLSKRM